MDRRGRRTVLAKFLAIDFDAEQFVVVSATVKSGSLDIHRALAWEEKQTLTAATAKALGQSLRDHLKAERIGPAPVLACVPRDRLILKEITYPPVSANDEPAIVRFQVLRDLTTAPEMSVMDYLPGPDLGANGERRTLVVVLPKELLTAYQELCNAAGLKLAGLVPRPFATSVCLSQQMKSEAAGPQQAGAIAILSLADRSGEFCVVKDQHLVLARAVAAPATGEESAIVGEIRRNLAVYAGQVAHAPVQALYVAEGGKHAAIAGRLKATLAIPVYRLDPFAGLGDPNLPTESRGAFAGAVGALYAQSQFRKLPINFLDPKEPKPPRDPHKWQAVAAAVAVLVLAVGTAVYGYTTLAARDREIKELNVVKIGLDGQLQQMEKEDTNRAAIEEWIGDRVIWLDELYDLTERFPNSSSAKLTILTTDPITRTRTTKTNHRIGRITLEGITTEPPKEFESFLDHMRAEGHYDVALDNLKRNQLRLESRAFPREFKATLSLNKRDPKDFQVILSAEPPARRKDVQPNAGQDQGFGVPGGAFP
jgi:Tfp pilus assembly PilM family ATPase